MRRVCGVRSYCTSNWFILVLSICTTCVRDQAILWNSILKENPFSMYSTWEPCDGITQTRNESNEKKNERKKEKSNYYPRSLLWNMVCACLCVVQEKCISCNNVRHISATTPLNSCDYAFIVDCWTVFARLYEQRSRFYPYFLLFQLFLVSICYNSR